MLARPADVDQSEAPARSRLCGPELPYKLEGEAIIRPFQGGMETGGYLATEEDLGIQRLSPSSAACFYSTSE